MKRVRFGSHADRGVTMIELVVVAVIIGILATIATNVYVGQAEKAKIAAARTTIRELAVAVVRHEIDTGDMPLSGSGTIDNSGAVPAVTSRAVPGNVNSLGSRQGNGFLYLALAHSMSGNSIDPYPITWLGPYIEFNADIILTQDDGSPAMDLPPGQMQILDPFGFPYEYRMAREYNSDPMFAYDTPTYLGGIDISAQIYTAQGTQMFPAARPADADPAIPGNNPFAGTERYYNRSTFQIFSVGSNGQTYGDPSASALVPIDFAGTEDGDISNFGY